MESFFTAGVVILVAEAGVTTLAGEAGPEGEAAFEGEAGPEGEAVRLNETEPRDPLAGVTAGATPAAAERAADVTPAAASFCPNVEPPKGWGEEFLPAPGKGRAEKYSS